MSIICSFASVPVFAVLIRIVYRQRTELKDTERKIKFRTPLFKTSCIKSKLQYKAIERPSFRRRRLSFGIGLPNRAGKMDDRFPLKL